MNTADVVIELVLGAELIEADAARVRVAAREMDVLHVFLEVAAVCCEFPAQSARVTALGCRHDVAPKILQS